MNQLAFEVQRVSERIDSMMNVAASSDEALNGAKTARVVEDVINNPRDIAFVINLARAAPGIEKHLQLHQLVVNTMAESNGILHRLLQEAIQWDGEFYASLQRVTQGIDSMMSEIAQRHVALNWAKVLQSLREVVKNPRDIETTIKLAQMARDVRGIYQLHQDVLNRTAESNALLHRLLSEAS